VITIWNLNYAILIRHFLVWKIAYFIRRPARGFILQLQNKAISFTEVRNKYETKESYRKNVRNEIEKQFKNINRKRHFEKPSA
jgi:hypothetical protein